MSFDMFTTLITVVLAILVSFLYYIHKKGLEQQKKQPEQNKNHRS